MPYLPHKSMSEYKFNCPSCGQHLKADETMAGNHISCPTCAKLIAVPTEEEAAMATTNSASASPMVPKDESEESPFTPFPAPPAPEATTTTRFPTRAIVTPEVPEKASQGPTTQVSRLTPEIKLDIVRSVRRRIADESTWLPRKTATDEFAYAAKVVGGKNVPVEVTSPEATRFSVLGAMLLEFSERNVTQLAAGRRELLDSDVLDALRKVLEEEKGEPFKGDIKAVSVTHAESLKLLDQLESRYDTSMRKSRAEAAAGKLDSIRMEQVVRMLETKTAVTPEDVATAVFFELEDIKRRLTELERASVPKP
jgi:DNA-directed RNA polymerase subunit RPC12/RpoP